MRIVIFSNTYKPTVSGVVTSIGLFRRGLIQAGQEVHVFAPQYQGFEDEEPYIFRFPAIDLGNQVDMALVIPFKAPMERTMRGIKPALIHSQHPIWMGDIAAELARNLDIPLLFTLHSRYDEFARQYIPIAPDLAGVVVDQIVGRYLRKCTHVIAPTPTIRDLILREYTDDVPVSVVPTPVDLSQYHDLQPQRIRGALGLENAELLLFLGRLAAEKNLPFLLRSFAAIAAKRPQARLLLVGKGPHESRLRRMVRKLNLHDLVTFAGPVPHTEIANYAAAADLLVFPSLTDTQGLVLIEAMAAGIPVVALEAPGPLDVLTQGGGVLVKRQEDAFADAVLELLGDKPRRRVLGEQAAQVAQRYSIASTTARLIAVYEEALAATPHSRR